MGKIKDSLSFIIYLSLSINLLLTQLSIRLFPHHDFLILQTCHLCSLFSFYYFISIVVRAVTARSSILIQIFKCTVQHDNYRRCGAMGL